MLVEGKLEKLAAAGGAINVLVDKVGSIDAPDRVAGRDQGLLDARRAGSAWAGRAKRPLPGTGNGQGAGAAADGVVEDFRAVAPPVMSFASRAAAVTPRWPRPRRSEARRDKVREHRMVIVVVLVIVLIFVPLLLWGLSSPSGQSA